MIRIALASLVLTTACTARSPFGSAVIEVDGRPLTVETAYTREARAQGVMGKDGLTDEQGVLFLYPDSANRSFWMKTVTFALDIAFIRSDGTIARIAQMQPYVTAGPPSLQPVQYALEMREGWFADHDVEVGDKVTGIPEVEAEP